MIVGRGCGQGDYGRINVLMKVANLAAQLQPLVAANQLLKCDHCRTLRVRPLPSGAVTLARPRRRCKERRCGRAACSTAGIRNFDLMALQPVKVEPTKLGDELFTPRTLRYRRNVLAIAAAIIAVNLVPDVDWSAPSVFNVKFKGDGLAAVLVVAWFVLGFHALNFVAYGYHSTRMWAAELVYGAKFPQLRMYFNLQPNARHIRLRLRGTTKEGEPVESCRVEYQLTDTMANAHWHFVFKDGAKETMLSSLQREDYYMMKRGLILHAVVDYGFPFAAVLGAAIVSDWQLMTAQVSMIASPPDRPVGWPYWHRPC